MNETLLAASHCAARGWRVFPVSGKVPSITDWPTRATTNAKQIREWFLADVESAALRVAIAVVKGVAAPAVRPPNIGVATGSASGIVVIDLDEKHGGPLAFAKLLGEHGDDFDTVAARTGGGGLHLYFAHPGGIVPNSVGKLGPGIDVRGDGGFVVAPPSLHASGERYEWEPDLSPSDIEVAPLPPWLLSLIRAPATPAARPPTEWVTMLSDIGEGSRNDKLARLAGRLFRTLLPVDLSALLVHAVNEARCKPPLPKDEVDKLLESIATREVQRVASESRILTEAIKTARSGASK